MSTVPLPTARPVFERESVNAAPEADQCGALARGLAGWLVPTIGTVSCVRPRDHDGTHAATAAWRLGRRQLTYRW